MTSVMGICERKKQRNAVRVAPSKVGMAKASGNGDEIGIDALPLSVSRSSSRQQSQQQGLGPLLFWRETLKIGGLDRAKRPARYRTISYQPPARRQTLSLLELDEDAFQLDTHTYHTFKYSNDRMVTRDQH